jgi:hypothetical protein
MLDGIDDDGSVPHILELRPELDRSAISSLDLGGQLSRALWELSDEEFEEAWQRFACFVNCSAEAAVCRYPAGSGGAGWNHRYPPGADVPDARRRASTEAKPPSADAANAKVCSRTG